MKRVYLQQPGQPIATMSGLNYGKLIVDPTLLRAAAVALANFAVNGDHGRDPGDPVHDWVTENRRKANEQRKAHGSPEVWYSSCGDLGNWLLMVLGCRNERVINRDWDGGDVPWKMGMNVARLVGSPWYVKATKGALPKPGDITHVCGNAANSDHIAVLEDIDVAAGTAHTFDYGQPYGRHCTRKVQPQGGLVVLGGRLLRGWVDIERVVYDESSFVPNDFVGGIEDDNPYEESLTIPPGVP